MTLTDAVRVLSLAHHRGVALWVFDHEHMRVLPAGWNGLDEAAPPAYTVWEAMTLAGGLVRIGAAPFDIGSTIGATKERAGPVLATLTRP